MRYAEMYFLFGGGYWKINELLSKVLKIAPQSIKGDLVSLFVSAGFGPPNYKPQTHPLFNGEMRWNKIVNKRNDKCQE